MILRSHPVLGVIALFLALALLYQPPTRLIIGDVLYDDGRPASGATIALKAGDEVVEATANDDGQFVLRLHNDWTGQSRYTVTVGGEVHFFVGEVDESEIHHVMFRL